MSQWNDAYAAMVEMRVEDQLRRMTSPLVGGGQTFFTEEDLQQAFLGTKNVDAGIDFGDQVVIAEVVTTQITVATRKNADVVAFNNGIKKFFLKKAGQLDATAANLLRDPQPDKSPLPAPARRIVPVAIRRGQFPITRPQIEQALRADARIDPIALLDLDELEVCETLRETHHLPLPRVIAQWQASDGCANSSPRTFLVGEYGGGFDQPPTSKQSLPGPSRRLPNASAQTGGPAECRQCTDTPVPAELTMPVPHCGRRHPSSERITERHGQRGESALGDGRSGRILYACSHTIHIVGRRRPIMMGRICVGVSKNPGHTICAWGCSLCAPSGT